MEEWGDVFMYGEVVISINIFFEKNYKFFFYFFMGFIFVVII